MTVAPDPEGGFEGECLLRVNQSVRSLMPALAFVLLAFFVSHWWKWSGPARAFSLAYLALEISLVLMLGQMSQRRSRSPEWGHLACLLAGSCVASVASLHQLASLEPNYLAILILLILCAGVVLLSWRWFAITALGITALGTVTCLIAPTGEDPAQVMLVMLSVLLVATGCMFVRRAAFSRHYSQMLAERSAQEQLRAALHEGEALGHELDLRVQERTAELVLARRGVQQGQNQQEHMREQIERLRSRDHLGGLASTVAHDLNNRLTVVDLNLALLLGETRQEPARQALAAARGVVGEVVALTRQMLAFSRRQTLEKRSLKVGELLESSRLLMMGLLGDQIELVFDLQCPEARVLVDRDQLHQVLLHLALNARQAMGGRGVLRLRADAVDGRVVLSVADTGVGLHPDEVDRVFEPFAHPSPDEGLGLAVVEGVVTQHGGSVWVQSTPGAGSTFFVALPREAA